MKRIMISFLQIWFLCSSAAAQQGTHYNLQELLKTNMLELSFPNQAKPVSATNGKAAITASRIVFLKNVQFGEGSIELDIKGRDVFQQCFLGIAFHAKDTLVYEAIYFRPFNFRTDDPVRRKHAVQYMYIPDYPWDRLRREHPDTYEAAIQNPPSGNDWFHAKITIRNGWITVYINGSPDPSLKVRSLSKEQNGKIGIWSDQDPATNDQFADLYLNWDK